MVMALAGNKADLEDKRKVAADVSFLSISLVVYYLIMCIYVLYVNYLFLNGFIAGFLPSCLFMCVDVCIKMQDARAYAEENGLYFIETSAKTAINVNDMFYEIGEINFIFYRK